VSHASRWAGLSPVERREGRRDLLVRAAYELFGTGGESAVTVRSVCRAAKLNTRYFYENFTDVNEMLGVVYDQVAAQMINTLTQAMAGQPDDRARLRAGIRAGLDFSSADPRRGRVLFTEGRTNPVLAARRAANQQQLLESVLPDGASQSPEARVAQLVGASMYAGAMYELAQQWLSGALGSDLDRVADTAVRLVTRPPRAK